MLMRCTYTGQKYPHICIAKHQYRKESEYKSTVIIYILLKENKYIFITENNLILYEYYITKGYKNVIYKEIFKVQKLGDAHEQQEEISRVDQEGAERNELQTIYC